VLVVTGVAASHRTLTDTFLSYLSVGSWKDSWLSWEALASWGDSSLLAGRTSAAAAAGCTAAGAACSWVSSARNWSAVEGSRAAVSARPGPALQVSSSELESISSGPGGWRKKAPLLSPSLMWWHSHADCWRNQSVSPCRAKASSRLARCIACSAQASCHGNGHYIVELQHYLSGTIYLPFGCPARGLSLHVCLAKRKLFPLT